MQLLRCLSLCDTPGMPRVAWLSENPPCPYFGASGEWPSYLPTTTRPQLRVYCMGNQDDEVPEKDAETLAANVCAAVLSGGKHDGRFAMSIDELRRAMDLSERQAEVAAMCGLSSANGSAVAPIGWS